VPTYVAADGISLHYDVHGDGPPRVALAGGAACHPAYLGDLAGISGRMIVPHLRGIGLSPAPADPERGSFWRQAEDVEALREHLGLERLVLTGHSAGTRIAVAYAAQYPERIERLLLITPPTNHLVDVESDAGPLIEARLEDATFAAAHAAREAGPDLTADGEAERERSFNEWQQACAPAGYAAWTAIEQDHARTMHYYLPAALAYFSVDPPPDLGQRMSAVHAPVLVVAGAQDALGIAPMRAVADLFPAGELVVLQGCGHFPWVERPAEFRQTAEDFLTR
jgi:pimeloyl-ACP methyl ester carboxylesterase